MVAPRGFGNCRGNNSRRPLQTVGPGAAGLPASGGPLRRGRPSWAPACAAQTGHGAAEPQQQEPASPFHMVQLKVWRLLVSHFCHIVVTRNDLVVILFLLCVFVHFLLKENMPFRKTVPLPKINECKKHETNKKLIMN